MSTLTRVVLAMGALGAVLSFIVPSSRLVEDRKRLWRDGSYICGNEGTPCRGRFEGLNTSQGKGRVGVSMMVRARDLRREQQRRVKEDEARKTKPFIGVKAMKREKRERRARFRAANATSGRRLLDLQKDNTAFFIGFLGKERAGRAQGLAAVEKFLKQATELRVGQYFREGAHIKLVDAGDSPMSELAGKCDKKLALLRRCDLLVHVVRCFDLKTQAPGEGRYTEDDDLKGEDGEVGGKEEDCGLQATPVEDMKAIRAEMAYTDLQFIEERARFNSTRHFWKDRSRAYNEMGALRRIGPALEAVYVKGGILQPAGDCFEASCLKDGKNGTFPRSRQRESIREIGFLTPKSMLYVASLPLEGTDQWEAREGTEDESDEVQKRAQKLASKVLQVESDHGLPAIAACLRTTSGQEALGAKVMKSIPQWVILKDPKVRKATKALRREAKKQRGNQQLQDGKTSGRKDGRRRHAPSQRRAHRAPSERVAAGAGGDSHHNRQPGIAQMETAGTEG